MYLLLWDKTIRMRCLFRLLLLAAAVVTDSNQFVRYLAPASFQMTWTSLAGFFGDHDDVFEPNRIADLSITDRDDPNLLITFEWTAPGNDFDQGQADKYEMRCYTDVETMREAFDQKAIPVHESLLPVPMPAGTRQRASVNVPWANDVFYYGLVAIDRVGNVGPVSNLIPVFIPEVTTTTPSPAENNSTAELIFKVVDSVNGGSGGESSTIVYLISAGITAFLLILITLFTVAICKAKNRRQKTLASAAAKIQNISSPIQSPSSLINPVRPAAGVYVLDQDKTFGGGPGSLPDVTMGEQKPSYDLWNNRHSEEPRTIHDCGLPMSRYDNVQPTSLLTLNNFPSYSTAGLLMSERTASSLVMSPSSSGSNQPNPYQSIIRRSSPKIKSSSATPGATMTSSVTSPATAAAGGGGVASDCGTSSTECGESEYSDHSGDDVTGGKTNVYNVSTSRIVTPPPTTPLSSSKSSPDPRPATSVVPPTPAPRTSTLHRESSSNLDSLIGRRKRQESLV